MAQATLRFCTNRRSRVPTWHVGIDDDEGDHHEMLIDDVAVDIPKILADYGLGRASVDIREDEPSTDVEAVLVATGRAARSLARFTDPKITSIKGG